MTDHPLPGRPTCPACGTSLSSAFNTCREHAPNVGDPVLCVTCRALLVIRADVEYPTDEEQNRFLSDPRVQHAIAALAEAHRAGLIP